MWIEVPMSFNSIDDKTDFIIETINHLERTIKIKKMSKEKYVHKAGSGSLFKNQYKDSDAKPDMVGSATTLEGNVVELAGWTSTTQAGEKYVSIKMSPPYVKDDGALPKLSKEETSKVDADLPF